ncbi:hypothetical protein C8J56DRAFT_896335 [Mycena floridula]|nr:hypothetical protein C8J56DRAFT_896335 [Mycena floridula]
MGCERRDEAPEANESIIDERDPDGDSDLKGNFERIEYDGTGEDIHSVDYNSNQITKSKDGLRSKNDKTSVPGKRRGHRIRRVTKSSHKVDQCRRRWSNRDSEKTDIIEYVGESVDKRETNGKSKGHVNNGKYQRKRELMVALRGLVQESR